MAALNLTAGSTVTLDESANLQNLAATPAAAGDSNDNDISASSLPAAFSSRLAAQSVGTAINAALSGYNGSNTGTNAFTFSISGTVTDISFTDANGAPLNGFDSGLDTADGEDIFLYTDTTNNNVVYGKTALNVVVFAAYLEETGTPVSGAKIWMVQYEAIANPDATNPDDAVNLLNKVFVSVSQDAEFNLAGAPSGQNLFLMFTKGNPTIVNGRISDVTIIATGKDPANQSGANPNSTADDINISTGDTINTSQAGGPTTFGTNSQMITEQEGIRFTFVTGARANVTIPNLDQNEADLESNIDFTGMFGARTADFDVVQLQSGKSAQVRITAYSTAVESGNSFIDGYAGDQVISITSVRVLDSVTGAALETYANGAEGGQSAAIAISITGGVAMITGVKAGYSVEYTTSADHNRVLIENGAALNASGNTHADFDIGGFRLLQVSSATAEVGSMMVFEDDGPSIVLATPTDTALLNTQDAQTIGAATDSATQDFAAAFGTTSSSFGSDGAGTTDPTFTLGVKAQGIDSGLKSDGATIYLYLLNGKVIGSTSATELGVAAANTVFDLAVNAAGSVTLQQFAEIDHALPGASSNYAAQQATMADDLITLTNAVTLTDSDGDTASDSKLLNIGSNIKFDDDGPTIVLATPTDTTLLNTQDAQTVGAATDSSIQDFAPAFGTTSSSHGADGAGSTDSIFTLGVKTQGGASGLTSDGAAIRLYLVAGAVIGSTSATEAGISATNTIFDVSVNGAGSVTLRQFAEIDHALPGSSSNYAAQQATMADDLITLTNAVTLTDGDGDTASDSKVLNIGANIKFDDHGPTATAISDLTGANDAQPIAGTYNFSIGADDVDNASTDGIVLNSLTGTTGGGRPITDATVSHFAEDATTVTYNFSFNYYPGPTSTTTQAATGTVVFNKTDGTFTFDLDQVFGGQTTFSTSAPLASFNYDTIGNNSPEIVVQKYSNDFFGVLSARSATPPSDSGDLLAGNNHAFVPGETFTSESAGFVNVATNTLGVNSDTVQSGELLNFDFYKSNPVSNPNLTSPPQRPGAAIVGTDTAYADAINITIDQITDGEDVAVLLKLFNASTNTTTTRLLIANSAADYQSAGGGLKVVSIGEDDYDSANYQITGLQVLSSTEEITGTGISLTGHNTVNLTATGTNYADTADNDVFKIIKIDVITSTTINSDVDLNFVGQVIDGDADFAGFDFDVHLEIDGVANLIGTTQQTEAIA
ncbi:DUF5801 repeats-in-toxin domain-containing protein [Variovorax sp. NFACC27]|uniref:beta strand repeat-containing protein n=1 Tax=unclassified Variovorax TaxID=663243 RepID=UPI00089D6B5D|nr:hypothetical protein SAMN03159371_02567 [Variovorax sp. NFACC28]SEG58851.1 hypothetical protein SAMN03159365_02647 [Variovorax sp. NFACC29]SFC57867.1 hypothetical protein SAMN03159379_02538 [Variovorax sp. NFACC26]SFG66113.1 hypothetical protein SAMN03159447_04286 [Variovorax sp. NFACC27]